MLRAVGFDDADFKKPQVGIASTWSMVTPCNMHINKLADDAAQGIDGSGGKSVIFNTITVSDGISMGTPGMRYSLVSREVIADSSKLLSVRKVLTAWSPLVVVIRICRVASLDCLDWIVLLFLFMEAPLSRVQNVAISFLYLKRWVVMPQARFLMQN